MGKIVILNESQLKTIVNKIITEQASNNGIVKVISKKDVKQYKRYTEQKNVLLNNIRDAISGTDALDLVEYKIAGPKIYYGLRAYKINDLKTYVDFFSNGNYKLYENDTQKLSGVYGIDVPQTSLVLYDPNSYSKPYGYVLGNGQLTIESDEVLNKPFNRGGNKKSDGNNDKTGLSNNQKVSKNCKYNEGTENFQKFLVDNFSDTFGKMIGGSKGVDGCWGPNTKKAWEGFCETNKEKYPKICKNYTGSTSQTVNKTIDPTPQSENPNDNTQLGTGPVAPQTPSDNTAYDPEPTVPETYKSRGEQLYFNNLYSKINKRNVVVGGRQKNRKLEELPKQLFYRNQNTILWRGTPLPQQDLNDLNNYLSSIGFTYSPNRSKEERKKNGDFKYLWTKKS